MIHPLQQYIYSSTILGHPFEEKWLPLYRFYLKKKKKKRKLSN
jgi:hypothetical protein